MTKPPLAKDILMSMTACPSPRDKETNRRGRKRAAAMLLMEILLPKVLFLVRLLCGGKTGSSRSQCFVIFFLPLSAGPSSSLLVSLPLLLYC